MRSRPQRRARRQHSGPHAKSRSDRRRHRLQRTTATGAEFQSCVRTGKMRAEPVSPSGTLLVNTLHSPSRQILHVASPSGRGGQFRTRPRPKRHRCRIVMPQLHSVKQKAPQHMGVRLPLWISCETCGPSLTKRTTSRKRLAYSHHKRVKFRIQPQRIASCKAP
jgi:hypothetical protein